MYLAATVVDAILLGLIKSMLVCDGAWYGVSVVALWVLLLCSLGPFDIFAV